MQSFNQVTVGFLALLLAACGGGGGGGGVGNSSAIAGCSLISGGGTSTATSVSPGCVGCSVSNPASAIDGNEGSFATLQMPAGSAGAVTLRAIAQEGVIFPSGSRTGMIHSISYGTSTGLAIAFNTYLDGTQQESFNFNSGAGSAEMDPSEPGTATFETSQQYDAVELSFTRGSGAGGVNARIHSFCAN